MRAIVGLLAISIANPAQAGLLVKAAPAGNSAFNQCDGYGAPTKKGDSLTTSGWLFGLASTTTDQRRGSTKLGADGVARCDEALANPVLLSAYTMRRAHLLQGKAIHQIASGQFEGALASLRQSDETGRNDPYFDRSIGQGNRALQAVALNGLGRKAEANSALDQMELHRPFATSQRQLAMRVRMQFDDERAYQLGLMEKMAAQLPSAEHQLFWMSMLYDDWSAALRYAPGVSYDDPKDHGNWRGALDDYEPYLDTLERAKFAGAFAYAQFAAGQKDASAQTMARAKAAVDDTMDPLPPLEPGQGYSKKEKLDFERRKLFGTRALEILKNWSATMTLRADAPALTVDEIRTRITTDKLVVPTLSDVLAQAKADTLEAAAKKTAILKEIRDAKDVDRLKSAKMSFETLVTMLPRPETSGMRVRYRQEDGLLGSGLDGYAVKANYPAGANTVRFGSGTGSLAMVDEGALLAAAQFAQRQGRDSFVVDAREPIQRTTRIYGMYGSGGLPTPSGYEVRLVVRPVNAAEATAWDKPRLISVAAVNAALSGQYMVPAR